MDLNQEQIMISLITDNIKHKAEIQLLKSILIAYISTINKKQSDAISSGYDENLIRLYESVLLDSPLKNDYEEYMSEDFLSRLLRGL